MTFLNFPFFTITLVAIATHLVCFFAAVWAERICNRDGWMREFWQPAQIGRLFNVRRSELRLPFSWRLIILARAALVTAIAAFILDLFINA